MIEDYKLIIRIDNSIYVLDNKNPKYYKYTNKIFLEKIFGSHFIFRSNIFEGKLQNLINNINLPEERTIWNFFSKREDKDFDKLYDSLKNILLSLQNLCKNGEFDTDENDDFSWGLQLNYLNSNDYNIKILIESDCKKIQIKSYKIEVVSALDIYSLASHVNNTNLTIDLPLPHDDEIVNKLKDVISKAIIWLTPIIN